MGFLERIRIMILYYKYYQYIRMVRFVLKAKHSIKKNILNFLL